MKNPTSLITALALAASALSALSATPSPKPSTARPSGTNPPSGTAPRRVNSVISALDADRDGVISSQEIAGAPEALLKLDKNKDNLLSAEELHPAARAPRSAPGAGEAPRAKRQPAPLISALDIDGDGQLSGPEIARAPAALRRLDKNNDGQLTREEYRPSRTGAAVGAKVPEGKAAKPQDRSTVTVRHARAPKAMAQ